MKKRSLASFGALAAVLWAVSACGPAGEGAGGSGGAGGTGAAGTGASGGSGGAEGGAGGSGGAACMPCGENASCDASGACVCDTGFTGDGQECEDIDECVEDEGSCHPTAECVNEPGAFSCQCPSGSVGEPAAGAAGCTALYAEVSSHSNHTCARRVDGAVVCFGNGSSGRLGNGLSTHQSAPVQAGSASNWKRVVAGGGHTCGIKETDNLWCWGANNFGQLGLGHTDVQLLPAYMSLESKWKDVALGDNHGCAVTVDGTLSCWGRNNAGQLGAGSANATEPSPVQVSVDPMAPAPDADWKQVAAGRDNTCAQKGSGQLYCWGQNSNLQAGKAGGGTVPTPFLVETAAGAADADWQSFSTGLSSCAIKIDGSLWCWGRNAEGELGDGTTTQTAVPKQVMPGTTWKTVHVGFQHVCGVRSSGTLWCWGRNQSAQIQAGSAGRLLSPTHVGDDSDWVDVAPGLSHTCGVKQDGRVLCWGARVFGQTGEGSFGHVTTPAQVGQEAGWSALASFGETTCAKDPSGDLACWGNSELGQHGGGATASEDAPLVVAGAPAIAQVGQGRQHACSVTESGGLVCTGSNANGALGTGNTVSSTTYGPIATAGKPWASLVWAQAAAGEIHSCAVATDGSLWCWGYNCYGQVDASLAANTVTSLTQVLPATGWKSVALGQYHTCATRTGGSLWCWGRNLNGQVGNGATVASEAGCANKTGPFDHGTGWSDRVSAGVNHTCAVRQDGTLRCWGGNANSQLGDNTTTERTSPVQIGADSDWADVSAANAFTCGRRSSGALYCWGANATGQLGLGDLGTRKTPTLVGSDLWSDVQAGFSHVCGLRMDGSLWCWGSGEYGQNGLAQSWPLGPAPIVEAP